MKGKDKPDNVGAKAVDPGAMLRETRKQVGAGVKEVADLLHLEESVIVAIEEGRHEDLPAPAFVRGYMRAYARLLRLDEDEVAERFNATEGARADPPPIRAWAQPMTVEPVAHHRFGLRFTLVVVVLLAAAASGLWVLWNFFDMNLLTAESAGDSDAVQEAGADAVPDPADAVPDTADAVSHPADAGPDPEEALPEAADPLDPADAPRTEPASDDGIPPALAPASQGPDSDAASAPSPDAPALPAEQAGADEPSEADTPNDAGADAASAPDASASDDAPPSEPRPASDAAEGIDAGDGAAAAADATAALAVGPDELVFRFSADCWVEVDDAFGDQLHADLYQAGDVVTVTGAAPFAVEVGNAPGVAVTFNGDRVTLEPHTNDNNVARLVLAK